MWDKLDALERRFAELNDLMSRPEIFSKAADYQRYARERAELARIVEVYQQFKRLIQEKDGVQRLLEEAGGDAELSQLGREELAQLAEQETKLTYDLKSLLLPTDADDEKNVIGVGTTAVNTGARVRSLVECVWTRHLSDRGTTSAG